MFKYNPTQNLVIMKEDDEMNNPTSFFFVSHERWGRGGADKRENLFLLQK
jgi:hypothetical protein